MESLSHVLKSEKSTRAIEGTERSADEIFLHVIFEKLLNIFADALGEAGFSDEGIHYFFQKLNTLKQEEYTSVLSLPAVLQERFFEIRLNESNGDERRAVDASIMLLLKNGQKSGFTLGYHTSPREIKRPEHGDWEVLPYELDDRDNMKMAYYSLDFDNLYLKRSPKYLYFVRAETGASTSHKRDSKNNWGRAPHLSIVGMCELQQILKEVQKRSTK